MTFQVHITAEEMSLNFKRIYKITNFPKLRSFQYRMLLGVLSFNKQLKIWKIKNDDSCSFCKAQIEDMYHFYYTCEITRGIWHELKQYLIVNKICNRVELSPFFNFKLQTGGKS